MTDGTPEPDAPAVPAANYGTHVLITVICGDGHVISQFLDQISEKYPFYCSGCGDYRRSGKYPWSLVTQVLYGLVEPVRLLCHDSSTLVDPDRARQWLREHSGR